MGCVTLGALGLYPVIAGELWPKVLEERPRKASAAFGGRRREAGLEVADLHDGLVRVVTQRNVVQLHSSSSAVSSGALLT